jgi:predicted ATPase
MAKLSSLPRPATSFVGREGDLHEISRRLKVRSGLMTLVGPPGVGKTRLSLEVAASWEARTKHAATFVDLGGARDAADVIALMLAARRIHVPDGAPMDARVERLALSLAQVRTLTILDNAEHVIASVASLFPRCRAPAAYFIVTSREPLRVEGEQRYEVTPLPSTDGIRLFRERAASMSLQFPWSDTELRAVSSIVTQLESMPLAIELAAARSSVLLPTEIARHLAESLAILRVGLRDAPTRHASLHLAIQWSFEHLEPVERRALAQCAVFHDGFTADAAGRILDLGEGGAVLDVLQSLREKSLLRAEPDPRFEQETRFHLYESVRSFASSVLRGENSTERTGVISRHAVYFEAKAASVAARAKAGLAHAEGFAEMGNILAAIRASEEANPAACARMTVLIAPVLATYHPLEARLDLLERAVKASERACGENEPAVVLCRSLCARGAALLLGGRLAEATADAERVLALTRSIDAAEEAGSAEALLARIAVDRMSLPDACAHAGRAVERISGEGRARALHTLGWIQTQLGEVDGARRSLTSALAACDATRDRVTEGLVLTAMGELEQASRRPDEAVRIHERAGTVARETGNRSLEALAALNLAYALLELPAFDRVAHHSLAALGIAREVGDQRLEVIALAALGISRQAEGELDEALASTTRALAIPAGEYAASVARICHAAILAERGALAEARAIMASLAAATSGGPAHSFRVIVELAPLFCDLGAAIQTARDGDLASAGVLVSRVRAALERGADEALEHPDVRLWRILLHSALRRHAVLLGAVACRLEIDASGRWFRRDDGPAVDCSERPVVRRLVAALARARVESPGQAVPVERLIESAWPGERIRMASARRRLQVAISRLRDLGLAGLIVNDADGYLLVPTSEIILAPGP